MIVVDPLINCDGATATVETRGRWVTRCRAGIGLGDNPPPHLPASRLRLPDADGQNGQSTESAGHDGPGGTFVEQPPPKLNRIAREQEATDRTKPPGSVTNL